MFCAKCGAENPDIARFCIKCGKPLLKVEVPRKVRPARAVGMSLWLIVVGVIMLVMACIIAGVAIYPLLRPEEATPTPEIIVAPIEPETPTWTPTPKLTVTFTPQPTETPRPTATYTPFPTPTATLTPLSPTYTPTPICSLPVDPRLAGAWDRGKLGCPTEQAYVTWGAWEPFEGGYMLWQSDTDDVYILYLQDRTNRFTGHWMETPPDPEWEWDGSNPEGVGMSPPPGLHEPKLGFGWLWRTHLGGPDGKLGWALEEEKGICINIQRFERGLIFRSTKETCTEEFNWATHPGFEPILFSLYEDGTWWRY